MATHEEIINIKVNEGQINAVTEKVRELHRLANKTINFNFGKGSNIGEATKMLNSLNRVAKNIEAIRELTSKPINLKFGKIDNMGDTTKFLNALSNVSKRVGEIDKLSGKSINLKFGKIDNMAETTKFLNSLGNISRKVTDIERLGNTPINLQFGKISNIGETTKFLNSLSTVSKRVDDISKLGTKPIRLDLGNIANAESAVKTFNSISNLSRNFGKLDMSKLSSGTAVIDKIATKIHQLNQEKIKITIDDNVTTKVLGHLEKIHAEIQTLNSTAKGINFDSITRSSSQFDRLHSELKQTNIELRELKANSNVNIRANYSGSGRNINGTSGNGHKANMFGFNADNSYAYQMGSVVKKDSQRLTRIAEKFNNIGGNLASFVSYAGVNKMTDILIETPARAEVQKYLLGNMQQGATTTNKAGEVASLYQIMDKTTDQLPVSMQNVVNPLYAFNASSQATPQQLADFIPTMANFGAQVINMTGSSERAETAMEKLAYAFRGSFQAVDQYGISAASMAQHGFDESMYGDPTKIEQFAKAIDEITGNAQDSMHNFNGMKQTVSKDFARSGKAVWNSFLGPLATGGLSAFHNADQSLGGLPTMLMSVGAAGLSVATTLTSIIGSAGTAVGAFAELSGSLRATMKNGGGLTGLLKSLSKSSFNELRGNYGYNSPFGMDSPHLTSIDGNVARIAGMQSSERFDRRGDSKYDTGSTSSKKDKKNRRELHTSHIPMSKDYQDLHRQFQTNKMDRLKPHDPYDLHLSGWSEGVKEEMDDARKQRKKVTELENKIKSREGKGRLASIQNWFTRKKLESEQNKLMTGSSKSMGKFGAGLKSIGGLFSFMPFGIWGALGMGGLALGGKIFSDSYARSQSVRDATTNFSNAVGNAGNSLKSALGNAVAGIAGYKNVKGEQALDQGITDALNYLARSINNWTQNNESDDPLKTRSSFPKEMTDAQYYGFEGWESEAEKTARQKLIDQIDRDTTAMANFVGILDPARANEIRAGGAQKKDWLRAGDYKTAGMEWEFMAQMSQIDPRFYSMTYDQMRQFYPNYSPMSRENQSYEDWYKYSHGGQAYNQTANEVSKMSANRSDLTTAQVNVNGDTVSLDEALKGENIMDKLFKNQDFSWLDQLGQKLFNPQLDSGTMTNQTQPPTAQPQQPQQQYSSAQMINSGQLMGQFFQNIDMAGLSQTINTKITEAMNTASSMITPNATTAGTNIMNSIQQGIQSVPVDFSSAFSGVTQAMDSLASEASGKGSNAGNNYSNGLGSGLAGASARASGEAGNILAALDIADEAYQKGFEAGQSFDRGYQDGGGMKSPGYASRRAEQEGKYMLGFMNSIITPARLAGYHTGQAYVQGFTPEVGLSYPNYSVPQINKENTAPHLIGNANNQKTIHLTQNINIEKVDSRDRAREIAEETLKIVTWNNETAGRSVEV